MSLVTTCRFIFRIPDIRESGNYATADSDITKKHLFWARPQPKVAIQCPIDDEFLIGLRVSRAIYY